MKLIIDIPESYYNLTNIQNGSIACSQILKAVKNGKPYEERPQGKWIYLPTEGKYKCPICDNTCKCDTLPVFRYCPWCGSDNLGDNE